MNQENCLFCRLIQTGDCRVVYEDDLLFAFLDITPVNPGHILIIPKVHREHFEEMTDQELAESMKLAKRMAEGLKQIYGYPKVGILVAGFEIAHAHIHVIPMQDIHDVCTKRMIDPAFKARQIEEKELSELADFLKTKTM